jgi:Matrixin
MLALRWHWLRAPPNMRTMKSVIRRLAIAAAAAVASASLIVPAHADDTGSSWTSIYEGTPYAGAGWSNCPDPIRVSVDVRSLSQEQRTKARKALQIAIEKWNRAKVVRFEFAGPVPVRFDPATGITAPEDGVARDRWIYLSVVNRGGEGIDPNVVGLAAPLRIDPATNIILEGSAAFRAKYVTKAKKAAVAELFAHELGHVFGLGHSTAKKDVMYPILSGHKELGAGDITGGFAVLKPCPAPPQPAPVPPTEPPAAG